MFHNKQKYVQLLFCLSYVILTIFLTERTLRSQDYQILLVLSAAYLLSWVAVRFGRRSIIIIEWFSSRHESIFTCGQVPIGPTSRRRPGPVDNGRQGVRREPYHGVDVEGVRVGGGRESTLPGGSNAGRCTPSPSSTWSRAVQTRTCKNSKNVGSVLFINI
ncbi:unnamed protein product [Acanthoscelides obtectus]|uniref:Uncharacterized protein n=1 Tax=Acanthoscelides obtectus TaxID=200917 RepID=A0A9P0M365_ACAOB|nr:unnamed protein product [Acanthoscelides obtectus]CAK1650035.1 hypothetical protein AOBTE_LOCUS16559 [Acanthoscelides obtectus]